MNRIDEMKGYMSWSTRELAELAGSTQKAIRYYHAIGLLDEPERSVSGYKHYELAHLRRLIHITTLAELGLPLARIRDFDDDTQAGTDELLDELEVSITAAMIRLQRSRQRLDLLRTHRDSWQAPVKLVAALAALSPAEQSVISIASRVLGENATETIGGLIEDHDPTDEELAAFPDNATQEEVYDLARRLYAALTKSTGEFPDLMRTRSTSPETLPVAGQAVAEAFVEAYRPAQLRVLARLAELARSGDD